MIGGTAFSKIASGIRNERVKKLLRAAAARLIPAAVGLLLAQAKIVGGMYPFGAAAAAAVPKGYSAPLMIGLLLGYLLPGEMTGRLRYIATALAVAGIKWALAELRGVSRSPLFPSAAAFTGMAVTGLVVSTSTGAALGISMLSYTAEGLLAAASAFFLSGAAAVLLAKGENAPDRQQICCCISSAVILSIPLCGLTVFGFSPVRVLLMVCVLIAAGRWREAGGAVAGIALGLVMALSGEAFALSGVSAAAGLLAALFAPVGAVMSAAAFSAACSLGSLASGGIDVYFLIEALAASTIYPLLRPAVLDRLPPHSNAAHSSMADRQPSGCTAVRLLAAADGLSGVSAAVCEASRRFDLKDAPDPEQIYRAASDEVCSSCAIASFCWGSAREKTAALFSGLTPVLRRDGALTRSTSPEALRTKCVRWGEMMESVNRRYADFSARERARRRVAQVRSVVSEQLGGVSELLCELAGDSEADSDPALCENIRRILSDCGYTAGNVRCTRDSHGRLTVNAAVTGRSRHALTRGDLVYAISDAAGVDFQPPSFTGSAVAFTMELTQKPPLRVEFGAAQHCCGGAGLCGDSYDALLDSTGGAVMLLSDGMGSGGRAAVDSAMTCGLLGQLLRAGFGVHGALRVVNSALLIKSDDESLSTADCMRVSLFTGEADFCKAGAAQSFVLSGGCVSEVTIPSLPLGIMRELDCGTASLMLSAGDVVLMVSDGAITGDPDWLRSELERFDGADPRGLARNIVSLAAAMRGSSADDDITALVLCCRDNAA